MTECDNHKEENRGRGRGGGCDNTSQIHDNVNPYKDKSMIKCYSCGKYEHYVIECHNKERDEEAYLMFTNDEEPILKLAEKMRNLFLLAEKMPNLQLSLCFHQQRRWKL